MPTEPDRVLRAWMPHLLLMGVLAGIVWLVLRVFSPLLDPLLLGACLAVLTSPLLHVPFTRAIAHCAPWLGEIHQRRLAAILATLVLVFVMSLPLILLIGSWSQTFGIAWGIIHQSPQAYDDLQLVIARHVASLDRHFPALALAQRAIPENIVATLREALAFGPSFLGFLFAGTSRLAHFVLAMICLTFFFSEGPRVMRALLHYTPLTDDQQEQLILRHRQSVIRLLHDTVAVALIKGCVFAGIAWAADHSIGSGTLPFTPLVLVASILTLLPVVGVAMIWVPLLVLFWSQNWYLAAGTLATASIAAQILLQWAQRRLARRIDDRDSWIGFLLFLGLLGGLLSFGLRGLVIGPVAVVMLVTLGSFWLPLYGVGGDSEPLPEDDAPPGAPSSSSAL